MSSSLKYIPFILLISCNRNTSKVIYQDKIVTQIDTIKFETPRDGTTVPCKDFETFIQGATIHDTIFIKSKAGKLDLKAKVERKVIDRQPIIITPQPKRVKIDNSVTAKKGSIIGDGNIMTTKKTNWWWVFLAGMLTMFILQNVVYKSLRRYLTFIP